MYNCLITGTEERRWWPHPKKLLVIMSDKHNRKITGYAEHPIVRTLALDKPRVPYWRHR